MQFLNLLGAVTPLLSIALARQFDIPSVDAAVAQAVASMGDVTATSSESSSDVASVNPKTDIPATSSYWLENIAHQGIAPYAGGGYSVFRNVKSYGAVGDGVTDDTNAIQAAIADGGRCGENCASTTLTPALVYFPAGTYLISAPIVDYYYTMLIGDADTLPTIKGSGSFQGIGLIDADPYFTSVLNWVSTNQFYRQIRNLQFDTTAIPANLLVSGVHWPVAQATSIQNCIFTLNSGSGTVHRGIFTESGSGGFVGDITINGGNVGWSTGNQQYTARNMTFNGCATAIAHSWDWGFTYSQLTVNNCPVGIDISAGGPTDLSTGSITVFDSTFNNVGIAIKTDWTTGSTPATANSVILENVVLNSVGTAVQNNGGTALGGGSTTIAAWGQGHQYSSSTSGPSQFSGSFTPNSRPSILTQGGSNYYARSKPIYNNVDASGFTSVRSAGAKGDGSTDDTSAIQNAINNAGGKIVFFDAGIYKTSNTIFIPAGTKIVGEAYPVIMSSGATFNDMNNPQPVVRVGNSGDTGTIEWSDMIVSTSGVSEGAILIEYNLASSTPSGIWDVHIRVGGFQGSWLQLTECPKSSAPNDPNCIGAYMLVHITSSATGLYMENNWFWTADHDIEDPQNTQITVYSGRGMLVESSQGGIWLSGSAVEHNTLYQYQFANTQNIYGGFLQTETPYYQPSPAAPGPFSVNGGLNDPDFGTSCAGQSGNCADAWGMRSLNSKNLFIYGAGFYSFFNDYETLCSNLTANGSEDCQDAVVDLENSSGINFYNLNTVGSTNMVVENAGGNVVAKYQDNLNAFSDTVALMRL